MAMIKDILKKLGLDDKEIAVYQVVLKYKKTTPAFVGLHTKISRPTVYSICERLTARGLLVKDLGNRNLAFTPAPSEELTQLLRKDKEELISKEKLISELTNELSMLKSGTNYPVPKIRFIEQESIEQYLYTQTEVWNESIFKSDGYWWGFQDHTLVEHYNGWINWFWQNNPQNAKVRLLSNSSKIEKKMEDKQYTLREIKYWNKSKLFSATTWINGDYIVMIVTDKEPHYLVEIHDKRMAENFREVFKNIWDLV